MKSLQKLAMFVKQHFSFTVYGVLLVVE